MGKHVLYATAGPGGVVGFERDPATGALARREELCVSPKPAWRKTGAYGRARLLLTQARGFLGVLYLTP
jgi:hypothetical protein